MGHSRGGITTKIHAIVDALGNPLRFELTAGNSHDCVKGYEMLQAMDLTGKTVIADRGYDMNNILELIEKQHALAVIPSRKHRNIQRNCDWWLYKNATWWNVYSTSLNIIVGWLLAMISYPVTFAAFLSLASILLWLN
ncbi:transposase [Paenibacillus larvae]